MAEKLVSVLQARTAISFNSLVLNKEFFDQVVPLVDFAINFDGFGAAWMVRYDDFGAALIEIGDGGVAVEGLVGGRCAKLEPGKQRFETDRIKAMSRQHEEAHEIATRIRQHEDSGGYSALGVAYGLILSPAFALCPVTMDLDDYGIDHGMFHVRLFRRCIEYPLENIGFHPIPIALEHPVSVAKCVRHISPMASCSHNPQYSLDKQLIVAAAASRITRFAKAMWRHLRLVRICQNKPVDPRLEPENLANENPKS